MLSFPCGVVIFLLGSVGTIKSFILHKIILWKNQNMLCLTQDDFCRLVGDSGCLGWDSGVGSDCFPIDPDQGESYTSHIGGYWVNGRI